MDINEKIKNFNIPLMIDGCQHVAHSKLNVVDIDCDFYVFSGHKLYGPSGVGVLYMKEKWFDQFNPYQGGGDMIEKVEKSAAKAKVTMKQFEDAVKKVREQKDLKITQKVELSAFR